MVDFLLGVLAYIIAFCILLGLFGALLILIQICVIMPFKELSSSKKSTTPETLGSLSLPVWWSCHNNH